MSTGKLLVSFWRLCLENLPEGGFTRRRIAPDDARLYVEQAREENTLLCLSDTDLMAPYHERERENHEALCHVLTEHFGIVLSLRDFCGRTEGDDGGLYSINPLNCVRVQGHDRLMIITCAYVSAAGGLDEPLFEIEPETVEFHLVEAAASRWKPPERRAPWRVAPCGVALISRAVLWHLVHGSPSRLSGFPSTVP